MKVLTTAGADVNMGRELPLIKSIKAGSVESVKELLYAGADVNSEDDEGNTCLMVAIDVGNETLAQLLVDKGAEVNSKNIDGKTALYLAVSHSHREFQKFETKESPLSENMQDSIYTRLVYILLHAGALVNDTSVVFSPRTAHVKLSQTMEPNFYILKMLMSAGADIEGIKSFVPDRSLQDLVRKCIRKYLKQVHPERNLFDTILQLSVPCCMQSYLLYYTLQNVKNNLKSREKEFLFEASQNNVDNVINLIQAGVDVNVQDENAMTALMIASQVGHGHLIKELKGAGVNLNIQNLHGDTALILATKQNNTICVQQLTEFGSNVNIQGENGQTALMHAVKRKNMDCVQALIGADANLNIQNDNGQTALMIAITESFEAVNMLIKADADVNLTCRKGQTALAVAAASGKMDCIKKLIETGADVNSYKKDDGTTPLMAAVQNGHVDCVRVLIQAGADVYIENKKVMRFVMRTSDNYSNQPICVRKLMEASTNIEMSFLVDIAREVLLFQDGRGTTFSYFCQFIVLL